MSVTPNQIVLYGSANMPEADGATIGGALDLTKRAAFADLTSTGTVDVVSSSASDTAVKVQISGRDSTGTVQTPAAVTLTGTTLIANAFGGQSFQRLLAGVITGGAIAGLSNPGGTAAVGDVAVIQHTRTLSGHTAQAGSANTSGVTPPLFKLQSGDGATVGALSYAGLGFIIRITGGTGAGQLRMIAAQYASGAYGADVVAVNRDWGTVPDATSTYDIAPGFLFDILPNPVTAIARLFATAASDVPGGSTRHFYEKIFAVNTNTTTSLQGANIEVLSETPSLPVGPSLTTNNTTASGNATLHFASVPSWVVAGLQIADATAPSVIPAGTVVLSTTSTTVVMSNNATGAGVGNGDAITFSTALDLALCDALNDTGTCANRQTLPTNGDSTSLTFVTQPSAINVPASPGTLPAGNDAAVAQGIWLRLTLPAGGATYNGAADVRTTGTTS
jgi:hypothetical protein